MIDLDHSNRVLSLFLDCNTESKEVLLAQNNNHKYASLEVSLMQNMLEWLFPKTISIDLNDPDYMEEFVWWMHNRESEEIYKWAQIKGFAKTRGGGDVDETVKVTFDKKDVA